MYIQSHIIYIYMILDIQSLLSLSYTVCYFLVYYIHIYIHISYTYTYTDTLISIYRYTHTYMYMYKLYIHIHMQIPHSKDGCQFAGEGPTHPGWLNAPARLGGWGYFFGGCDGIDITKPVIFGHVQKWGIKN